jgi:hypothetical protein
MTRISFAFLAALALGICACERHPLPNQTLVTATHGSDSHHAKHDDAHGAHGKDSHGSAEKAEPAKAGAHGAGGAEPKPTFFPEKK